MLFNPSRVFFKNLNDIHNLIWIADSIHCIKSTLLNPHALPMSCHRLASNLNIFVWFDSLTELFYYYPHIGKGLDIHSTFWIPTCCMCASVLDVYMFYFTLFFTVVYLYMNFIVFILPPFFLLLHFFLKTL